MVRIPGKLQGLREVTKEDEIPPLLTLITSSFLSDTGPQARGYLDLHARIGKEGCVFQGQELPVPVICNQITNSAEVIQGNPQGYQHVPIYLQGIINFTETSQAKFN